jgi:hypothetical protein
VRLAAAALAAAAAVAVVAISRAGDGDRGGVKQFPAPLLVRNLPPDAIPALDRPRLVRIAEAGLPPSTAVVGVARDGDARAYPIDLLALHEIVNDSLAGLPIAITWCPLCRTAVGFSRRAGRRVLTFRVSGLLRSRNLVLEDRETRTLWTQIDGRAVRGRLRGETLDRVVVTHTSLERWRREHPRSLVLPIEGSRFAERLRSNGIRLTQYGPEEAASPYSAYYQKAPLYFGRRPIKGLSPFALVLGFGDVAIPLGRLAAGAHVVRVRGRMLRLVWRPLELDARLYDGGRRVDATVSYWFAWAAFHPRARVVRLPAFAAGPVVRVGSWE